MITGVPKALLMAALLLLLLQDARTQSSPSPQPGEDQLVLTVRILPSTSLKTLEYIASVTEPIRYEPSGDKSYKQIIKEHYGVYNHTLRQLVSKYNPQMHRVDDKPLVTFVLPTGPHWSFGITRVLGSGSNAWIELQLLNGSAGDDSIDRFKHANPRVGSIMRKLPIGLSFIVPYAAAVTSSPIRREYVTHQREIIERLKKDHVLGAQIAPPARLVPNLPAARVASVHGTHVSVSPSWQFDNFILSNPLKVVPQTNTAVVAVLDSGIPLVDDKDTRFRPALWTNDKERVNDRDDDENTCIDDIYGCNFMSGSPRRYPLDDDVEPKVKYHGTQMAGLIGGRLLPPEVRPQVERSLRLMILKVVDRNGIADCAAIANAILYAHEKRAQVINMSLEMDSEDLSLRHNIEWQTNSLFVVAAGNDQKDIDSPFVHVFPAQYSRSFPHVMTVAAHDLNGKLLDESNRGKNTVDLAAPGSDVTSTTLGDGEAIESTSGTSQAAAMVSFAAALVFSRGITDPLLVKQRILLSVDYDSKLSKSVRSGGRLDVVKALLSLDNDVVSLQGDKLLYGRIENLDYLQIPALSTPLEFASVGKVIFNVDDDTENPDIVISYGPTNVETRLRANLDIFPISLKLPDGRVQQVYRGEIQDLVPAARHSTPR